MKVSRYIFFSLLLSLAATVSLFGQVNDTYVIPVAGNTPGAFGTRWMTRVSVFNPHSKPLKIAVVYVPTQGGTSLKTWFTVPANAVAASDNVLQELFNKTGSGALLFAAFIEDNPTFNNNVFALSFLVTSETYNNSSTGTYSQTIPGVWAGLEDFNNDSNHDGVPDNISSIAHGIRNIASQGWRTNVGATNLGRTSVRLLVSVYDYDGNIILNKAPFIVPPMAHFQDRLPVEVDNGAIEFFLEDSSADKSAVVFPYTSTIDQLSGDPTYQSPTLYALPSEIYLSKTGGAENAAKLSATAAHTLGKKIDSNIARSVRAQAVSIGESVLKPSQKGLRIIR